MLKAPSPINGRPDQFAGASVCYFAEARVIAPRACSSGSTSGATPTAGSATACRSTPWTCWPRATSGSTTAWSRRGWSRRSAVRNHQIGVGGATDLHRALQVVLLEQRRVGEVESLPLALLVADAFRLLAGGGVYGLESQVFCGGGRCGRRGGRFGPAGPSMGGVRMLLATRPGISAARSYG